MRYLLDVNSLIALGLIEHTFHDRVVEWVRCLPSRERANLATCAITELGFVRILAQVTAYGFTVTQAHALLLRLKTGRHLKLGFIEDDHDASHLPSWVKTAKQTTDGHLAELARAHGAVLATLDERVPGAFLIP